MSKVDKIHQNYYKEIPQDTFKQIIGSDPTSIKKNELVIKLGKYSQWLLKIYKENKLLLEDLYKATEYLTAFHSFKEKHLIPVDKRDILKYESLPQVFEINQKIGGTGKADNKENILITDRHHINNGNAKIFFEDKDWLIVILKSYKASEFYANKSQWCTRYPDMFSRYHKQGPLYVLIDKNKLGTTKPSRRMQFHFESRQFMNIVDYDISVRLLFKKNIGVRDAFGKLFDAQWEKVLAALSDRRYTINMPQCLNLLSMRTEEEEKHFFLGLYKSNRLPLLLESCKGHIGKKTGKTILQEMLNDIPATLNSFTLLNFVKFFLLPFGTNKQIQQTFEQAEIQITKEIFELICYYYGSANCKQWLVDKHFKKVKHCITNEFFQSSSYSFDVKKLIANKLCEDLSGMEYSIITYMTRYLSKDNLKICGNILIENEKLISDKKILSAMSKSEANEYFQNIFPSHLHFSYIPLSKLNNKNLRNFWIKTLAHYYRYGHSIDGYYTRTMPEDLKKLYIHLIFLKRKASYWYPISYIGTPKQREIALNNGFIKLQSLPNGRKKRITKPLNKRELAILNSSKNIRSKRK